MPSLLRTRSDVAHDKVARSVRAAILGGRVLHILSEELPDTWCAVMRTNFTLGTWRCARSLQLTLARCVLNLSLYDMALADSEGVCVCVCVCT